MDHPPPRTIYVASSWRNFLQPLAVRKLVAAGLDVYDFRAPPGGHGWSWSRLDPHWDRWSRRQYIEALDHPLTRASFDRDFAAMAQADACLLVLPAGASAHLEAGYFAGHPNKQLVIMLAPADNDPLLIAGLQALGHTTDERPCPKCGPKCDPECDSLAPCAFSTPETRARAQRADNFEPELMYGMAFAVVETLPQAIEALTSAEIQRAPLINPTTGRTQ